MTNRYNGFIVVLEKDIREDDAESLIAAIRHIRGVSDVKPNVANITDAIAYSRARTDLHEKLYAALKET